MRRRNLAAALIAICAAGCGSRPGPSLLFPKTGEVTGWSQKGMPRTFEAAVLWRYIDGDAERYVRAGVVRTFAADYRHADDFEAAVDIHVMRNMAGARKILESDSVEGSQPLAVGDAGRNYGTSLTFRRGRYFVRLVAYQEAPEMSQDLVELGRAIDARLQ